MLVDSKQMKVAATRSGSRVWQVAMIRMAAESQLLELMRLMRVARERSQGC